MIKTLLVAVLLTSSATPSFSQQAHKLKPLPGGSSIIVWKSDDAQSEANQLINSGIAAQDPQMLAPYVACIAPPGTQVIITDMGFVTHDIMIPTGPNRGRRGNIPAEVLD